MYVLGIWDGHDSGVALIKDNSIVYAANEERFTKRKLEVAFPYNSIKAALAYASIKPGDVEHVAFTTVEFAKTVERMFPGMKESYYMFRRRKMLRPSFENARHNLKYSMTSVGVLPLCKGISCSIVRSNLRRIGFVNFKLHVVDHHTAHAASAAFTSPYKSSLVITLDGLGDGLSGSVSTLQNGKLERQMAIGARDSIGIFFEQVTNIVGMRELEDEGKVMAMADYSYPFDYEHNRFKDFFSISGTRITARYSPTKQYELLQRMAWQMPREQFAYMAQQLVENSVMKFTSNVLDRYGMGDAVFSGGTFANIKANMRLRNLDQLRHWYVFPHMGDGGIALGAALYANYMVSGSTSCQFSPYLGNSYSADDTKKAIESDRSLKYEIEDEDAHAAHAAELIRSGNYLMWFQGRMEYGPRALGNRSIIAPSDSEPVKDRLNLYVKKREWFQPFAPSILEGDAPLVLDYDNKGYDKFMTSAYYVREGLRDKEKSVIHIDGSARVHMVGGENAIYSKLLNRIKRDSGYGIVLNTSFNIHGMPIVMAPEDAIATMKATRTKYMFINGVFVTNRNGV
ncbi:MAG: carbamoyltransferase C-terminal domain-containing protein [Candidatus Micrarchaeaceae archaeon]